MSKLLCPNSFRFCPNFQQIKNFGGALAPPALPPPTPLGALLGLKNIIVGSKSVIVGSKIFVGSKMHCWV